MQSNRIKISKLLTAVLDAHGRLENWTRPSKSLFEYAVGLAAWILDHDARSHELIAHVLDGQPEGLTRDDVLDNVTLYRLTNTAVSASRQYWENKLAFFAPKGRRYPRAVSVFPDEIYALRGVGQKGLTPSSPISTSSTKAGTLQSGTAETLFRRGSRGLQTLRK